MSDNENTMIDPRRMDRRSLLRSAGIATAGVGAMGLLSGFGGCNDNDGGLTSGISEIDILIFALNLEYLEAEYYLRGVTGAGLNANDAGTNPGAVTGGSQVQFQTPVIQQYAQEIANDELAHVRFLRQALGGAAPSRPAINFTDAFNAAAQAAGIGQAFDPFADEISFMLGAFVFEDVGVTAYKGGATGISTPAFLEAAAGILGVEAYHAGTVRTFLFAQNSGQINQTVQQISDLRDSVDNGEKDQGIVTGGNANIVPTDSDGIVFSRTAQEVLNIVYLNANGTPGGFFPNGLNGNIK